LINGKSVITAASIDSLKLKSLKVGKNTVEVKAFDAVGNFRSDKISVLYNPLVVPKQNTVTPKTPTTPKPTTPSKPKITVPAKPKTITPIKSKTPVRFD
jgi:hypothetical protein